MIVGNVMTKLSRKMGNFPPRLQASSQLPECAETEGALGVFWEGRARTPKSRASEQLFLKYKTPGDEAGEFQWLV